jgi:hypothetical protein
MGYLYTIICCGVVGDTRDEVNMRPSAGKAFLRIWRKEKQQELTWWAAMKYRGKRATGQVCVWDHPWIRDRVAQLQSDQLEMWEGSSH